MIKIGQSFWLTDFYVLAENQFVSRHGAMHSEDRGRGVLHVPFPG